MNTDNVPTHKWHCLKLKGKDHCDCRLESRLRDWAKEQALRA